MDCFLLQDWTTIRGASSPPVLSVTQTQAWWMDLSAYQDIVTWLDVREVTGPTGGATGLYLDIQTAPTRDDAFFLSMVSSATPFGIAIAALATPTVNKLTKELAATPLSRWLRWQINTGGTTPTATWDVTFRVFLAANFRRRALPVGATAF